MTSQPPAVAGSSNMASLPGVHEIRTRASHPRQLIIYDSTTGEWSPVNDSNPDEKKIIITTDYLAVSYRQSDFPDKSKLESDVRNICEKRDLNAYWLDFACTGATPEEKNEDLYRIADVFREAKETVIMIPEGRDDGWKSWGGRVWTFPEALLSKKLLFKDGKKRVQETNLRQAASLAFSNEEDQERLVALYGTNGKDFSRFKDRFKGLCRGIWSRTSGPGASTLKNPQFTAWPGERVYALMGFLQCRITPNPDETEKEAFCRLLDVNELECEDFPWEVDKEFKLWDKIRTNADVTSVDIPLPYVQSAKYSDGGCAVKKSCEKGTRAQILETIKDWVRLSAAQEESNRVFWIHGLAGSGKSTIARTVAEFCDKDDILAATFFCSRDSAECSDIQNIFCTISYQLCQLYSPFKAKVLEEIKLDKDLPKARVDVQLKKLIVGPLKAVKATSCTLNRYVIVIDALDECKDDMNDDTLTSLVLSALSEHVGDLAPLKFLITSRPEENIRSVFFDDLDLNINTKARNLGEEAQTESDIRLYLRISFRVIGGRVKDGWPSEEDINALVEKSAGLFIFASTAVKFLKDRSVRDPRSQLRQLLFFKPPMSATSPYTYLDHLYLRILEEKFADASTELLDRLKKAFAILLAALEPLTIDTLDEFLSGFNAMNIFEDLRSLVLIPESEDDNSTVRFIHPSIQDFLMDEERCTNRFLIKRPNNVIAEHCAKRLLLCADEGTTPQELSRFVKVSSQSDRRKNAIEYASHYIGNHLRELQVDELNDIKGSVIAFLYDDRLCFLFHTFGMRDWAKTILLKLLMEGSLSQELSLKLYTRSMALLFSRVDLKERSLRFRSLTDVIPFQLLEAKDRLAVKYPDAAAFKIKVEQFVRVESLLSLVQLYLESYPKLSAEMKDIHILLCSEVVLNNSRSLEFNAIIFAFAKELETSLSQTLFDFFRKEDMKMDVCKPLQSEWMSLKQVWRRYRDFIHYYLKEDGHNLTSLYDAAFEAIRKRYDVIDLDNESRSLFRALIWTALHVSDTKVLCFLYKSASIRCGTSLNIFCNALQIVLVRYPALKIGITDISNDNIPSRKEFHVSTSTAVGNPLHHEQTIDHSQTKDTCKQPILNHSILVELASEIDMHPEEKHFFFLYMINFDSIMVRWCLLKVKEVLQGLDGNHYYHSASGFPCIDLQSSLQIPEDDELAVYAIARWYEHVGKCAGSLDNTALELLEYILSNGEDLYYATFKQMRLDLVFYFLPQIIWKLHMLFFGKQAVPQKLMQLLYDNAIYYYLPSWMIEDSASFGLNETKASSLKEAWSNLQQSCSYHNLYELQEDFPELQVTLLAYRIGYMMILENTNDPGLVEKALSVRKLAKMAHDTIVQQSVPKDEQAKSTTIRGYLDELYRVLLENRRPLFIRIDSDSEDNARRHMVLNQAVDACAASLETFLECINKISSESEVTSSNEFDIFAGFNMAFDDFPNWADAEAMDSGDEAIMSMTMDTGEGIGDWMTQGMAVGRNDEVEEDGVDTESEIIIGQEEEIEDPDRTAMKRAVDDIDATEGGDLASSRKHRRTT